MEIKNKTKRALAVSLPGGKKLRLGPGKTGQITSKAVDFPAVQKMIEAEELEVIGGGRGKGSQDSGTNTSGTKSQTGGGGGSLRHTGDR